MADMTGKCACGRVTWRSAGPVLWAGHCHCDSCRRASSAAMVSFFGVPREGVIWTGEIAERPSSNGVRRGFCPACGTQLYYQADKWPAETHLYATTLDDPARFEPQAHYHWAERLPWLAVTDDLPRYSGSADDGEPI